MDELVQRVRTVFNKSRQPALAAGLKYLQSPGLFSCTRLARKIIPLLALATLLAVPAAAQTFRMSNAQISTCSGRFFDSGDSTGQYANGENYTMSFCSSQPGKCIQATFTFFTLESGNDTLYIYNGPTTSAPLLGKFTGSTIPIVFVGTSGCLTFRFTSNGSQTRAGWAATIACINCMPGPCRVGCPGTVPSNDACSGALYLDTLPRPAPCTGTGMAAWHTRNTSNLCATAEYPYSSMKGCYPSGSDSMAEPSSDVWYKFVITAPLLNLKITGLQNPTIGLYRGTSCTTLTPVGCAVGSNGFLNTSFTGLMFGTYYLQVSGGNLVDQCAFILELQNNFDCQGCVIQAGLTATPPPVNGTYLAGQRVSFCYTITDYQQYFSNWLHGVCPSFGPGWDLSTLTAFPAVDCPTVTAVGTWSWYSSPITSSYTGNVAGPGFFFETASGGPALDANPGNNYGDYNPNNACDWTFCWDITTKSLACVQGTSLNINIDTYGDGETGSWGSTACTQDAITMFFAELACCEPPQLNVSPISCAGSLASATANGQGLGPWNYVWRDSTGAILQTATNVNGSHTITGLTAGLHYIEVTDKTGCTSSNQFVVSSPFPVAVSVATTNATCLGGDGSATASVLGGTAGYTYSWSPSGGTAATASGLAAGTYTVTVTDTRGCIDTATVTIAQPAALNVVVTQVQPVLCNAGANGSATVSVSGGSGTYAYQWTPSGGTSAGATGLAAGNYTITVTDNQGCSQSTNITINQPLPLAVNFSNVSAVTCNGAGNGSITAAVAGGSPGYVYSWAPSGGNMATASGLSPGSYTISVTDINGCTATATTAIVQPTALAASVSNFNHVACAGGNTGTVTVSALGGTPGYSYAWSPSGGNGATATQLLAGNYSVLVTDASGCTQVVNATINEPAVLDITIPVTQPVSCFGGSNGSATANATGGAGGNVYSWSPAGGNGTVANNLSAGNYTVTVTDANGCQASATTQIQEPQQSLTYSSAILASPACGSANGSAAVTPSGGTLPYSYAWSPSGGTASTAVGLGAGSYTVTVTDANGCTAQANIILVSTLGPTAAIASITDVSCAGGNDGSATVSASNGTPGYSFDWQPTGGNLSTATGLPAGNYSVTVTDANGCQSVANVFIDEPVALVLQVANNLPASCFGASNGSAAVNASGGTPGYIYAWNPSGATTPAVANLPAGNYSVTVTDNEGCIQILNLVIDEPDAMALNIVSTNDVSCHGGSDGTALAAVAGGTPGYSFSWSPSGGNAASALNLATGTYTVTVTDANGCTTTSPVNISEPPLLNVQLTASAPVSCFGGTNGSASVNVSGGTPGYSYSWLPSGGAATSASGLSAGNYSVVVTDNEGCSENFPVVIGEPQALVAVIPASSGASCNGGSDGSALASASGGTPGYNYSWTPSGSTQPLAGSLSAGLHTVTITDAYGCTATAAVNIVQPAALLANITNVVPASCNGGNDGSAVVAASGGTPGYSYSWNPGGGNAASATGLPGGNYTVTVTDSRGCVQVAQAFVNQPALLQAGILSVGDVSCFGGANGTAQATALGGTQPYQYSWSPSGGTNASASGLSQGTYTVTVTDANGCMHQVPATVNQPPVLDATVVQRTDALCHGGNTGSAALSVQGGTPGYSYAWLPSGGNASSAAGLQAGNYSVTVTDQAGCNQQVNVIIGEPPLLDATIVSPVHVNCFGGNNGSASVSVNGGTPGYSYIWNPAGGTANGASNLIAGNYSVTVTDASGCTATAGIAIVQPPPLNANISSFTDVLCFGGTDGTVAATANGGTGPYQYSWQPAGGTAAAATGLGAGTYTVSVTDANGCTTNAQKLIGEPQELTAGVITTDALCGSANGTAAVVAAGGTGPYSYAWTPGGGTNASVTGLAAGNYSITITDQNNCTLLEVASVSSQGGPNANASVSKSVSCAGGNDGAATVQISSGTGPFIFAWLPSGGNVQSPIGLSAGTYSVTVTDSNNCISTDNVIVPEPTPLDATVTPVDAACFGDNSGSAQVLAQGGTSPYRYLWSQGDTLAAIASLTAGNYFVNITDAHGCAAAAAFSIGQPTQLMAAVASIPPSCFGGSNGSAMAQAMGGSGGYSYQWSPFGGGNAAAAGLPAGNYAVTVTDGNGCTTQANVQVQQPQALNPQLLTSSNVSCVGDSNGTATVSVTGGTLGYQYLWLPSGGTSSTANTLSPGNYTVRITDANGCIANITVNIGQPAPLLSAIQNSTDASCFGSSDGTAAVFAQGGTPGYVYSWSPSGGSAAVATGLAQGNYSVTITDNEGCTSVAAVIIGQPDAVAAQANELSPVSCYNGDDGSAAVSVSGGTAPYVYQWSQGGNQVTANNLVSGNYTVIVTDNHGCTDSAVVNVHQPAPLALAVASQPASCNASNGSAQVLVLGGTQPYSYLWITGSTNANLNGVSAGSYTITVTDANGCILSDAALVQNINGPVAAATAVTHVSCFGGNNGSATVNVGSGTPPYQYAWLPAGGTGTNAGNLTAGNYSITVTDALGCISVDQVVIQEPDSLVATAGATDALCFGSADGTATAGVQGGTGPYSYTWNPGGIGQPALTGLTVGSFTVSVTDANGCMAEKSVQVNQPLPVGLQLNSTPVNCFGDNSGAAAVQTSGGTFPYDYNWSNGDSAASISSLLAGRYTVVVSDAHNCSKSDSVDVVQPPPLQTQVSTLPSLCGLPNGSASAQVTGGSGLYTYAWTPGGAALPAINNLPGGMYSVQITDGNGCILQTAAQVLSFDGPVATASMSRRVSCYNGNDGAAVAGIVSGTPPFTYQWSGSLGTAPTATGLTAGTYSLSVTDSNGCLSSDTVLIRQPAPILLMTFANPAACNTATGTASVVAQGGTQPYAYLWTSSSSTNSQATGLVPGIYSITVTDSNSCIASASVAVQNINGPQPSVQSQSDVSCYGGNDGSAAILLTGGSGTGPFGFVWSPSGGTAAQASGLAAGNYSVLVTDALGCQGVVPVVIGEPPVLQLQATTTPSSCGGLPNGTAGIAATGGTPPYQYQWSNGGTTSLISGLLPGNYSIQVTDNHGCNDASQVQVTTPSQFNASISATDVTCHGLSNGLAAVQVNGGSPPYQFAWSPGGYNTAVLSGLPAGIYVATITDSAGCMSVMRDTVNQPSPLVLLATGDDTLCFGQQALLTASASGGIGPYSFGWSNGFAGASQSVAPSTQTTYSVQVTDANGCVTAAPPLLVRVNPPLTLSASAPDSICAGTSVTVAALAGGGNGGPYSFSWNGGAFAGSTGQVAPLSDTTFTVVVTDGCSMPAQAAAFIRVHALPAPQFMPQMYTGCAPLSVAFLNASVAPAGSVYTWTFGDGTSSVQPAAQHLYASPGQYNVSLTIRTPQGCQAQLAVPHAVKVFAVPEANFGMSGTHITLQEPLVKFTDLSNDATSWTWNFGDNSGVSHAQHPVHTYRDTGVYTVMLIAQGAGGCRDTLFRIVSVEEEFNVYIPNAFTPNDDGVNDGFIAKGTGIGGMDMWIFDRWGVMVYHGSGPEAPWNGRIHNTGEFCMQDVYVYKIRVLDMKQSPHEFVGKVTLVR